jgi:hypothetical protein
MVTEEEYDSKSKKTSKIKTDQPEPPKKPKKQKSTSPADEEKKPKKETKKSGEGHWELPYWVFANGKKTHLRHINYGVIRKREIPSGFYKASEGSQNFHIHKMLLAAKKLKLKEGNF